MSITPPNLEYACESYDIGSTCYPSCGDPLNMAVLRDTVEPQDTHPGHQTTTKDRHLTLYDDCLMEDLTMEGSNDMRRRDVGAAHVHVSKGLYMLFTNWMV